MTPLTDGWTVTPAPGADAAGRGRGGVRGRSRAGHGARLRAHRPARRRPDPRPVPRRQRDAAGAGSAAPTGSTRPRSTRPTPASRPASTWSATGSTPSRRSRSTASRSAAPRTCTAATASTSAALLRAGGNHAARSASTRRTRYAEALRDAARRAAQRLRRSRSTSSARWPATSAGTGARRWSPPASGSRSGCTPGRSRGWPRSVRWSRCDGDDRTGGRARRGRAGRRRAARPSTASPSRRPTAEVASIAAGRDRRRRVTVDVPDVDAVVAARVRRPAALRRSTSTLTDADGARAGPLGAADRLPHGRGSTPRRTTHGTPFTVVVNDVPVFVEGVNWIPDDAFPTRITRERLADAAAPGAATPTSTSCGSGAAGVYESRGLLRPRRRARACMVGQDFLFACAAYPEEEPLALGGGGRGARAGGPAGAATRAWCCGSATTRTSGAAHDWGWQEPLGGRTWGAGYYLDLLPRDRGRAGPDPAVLAGQPVLRAPATSTRTTRRTARCTSGTCGTPTTTRSYRDVPAAVRRRVRLPGAAGVRDAAPGARRRAAGARLARHARTTRRPIDGDGKLRRGLDGHLPAAARLRRLALPHPAQPGPGDRARARALPVAAAALHGRDRLAAQRLLAGHLLGGGRRRRAAQAAVVRAAPRRTPTGCSPIQPRDGGLGAGRGQRRRRRRGRPRSTWPGWA